MKSSVRSLAFAVGIALAATACTDQQNAAPAAASAPAAAPAAAPTVDAATLEVVLWGPKSTPAGTAFNVQPGGDSGIFVELNGDVPPVAFEATIGGRPLGGVVASGKIVTGTIPSRYLQTPGTYPVELVVPAQNVRIPVGTFTVEGEGVEAPADETANADTPPPSA